MTLQSPLAIELQTAQGSRRVNARELNFTKSARGGYQSAQVDLAEAISTADPAVQPESRCRITDQRTAEVVWEGYLGQPGRTVTRQEGHLWQAGAVGTQSVLADRSKAYIGVDRILDSWYQKNRSRPGLQAEVASKPSNDLIPALLERFPAGTPVTTGDFAMMEYDRIWDSGQLLGGFAFTHDSGRTAGADWFNQSRVGMGSGGFASTIHDDLQNTAPVSRDARWTTQWVGNDANWLVLRFTRKSGGATTPGDDSFWSSFYSIHVMPKFFDKTGAGITTAAFYQVGWLHADEVVVDALQHFTNMVDVAGATIASFTHDIDQLAYDSVRLPQVFDDVALMEPEMYWKVGPSGFGLNGNQHSFQLGRYDETNGMPRYEFSVDDGYQAPGSESQLANGLRVFWTDKRGQEQSSFYSTTVAQLDQWGRTRDAEEIHLSAEIGSQVNADRIGAMLLPQLNTQQVSATVSISRPVRDLVTGRLCDPWQLEPGCLVQVRGSGDPILRFTEMAYRDSEKAATCTLGTPVYSTEELVNRLATRRSRRGGQQTPLTV